MNVVFYSGEHCPTCKVMEPVIRELYPDVEVCKLTSDSVEIGLLKINSVPVTMVINNFGKESGRLVGGVSKVKLREFLVEQKVLK